GEHELSGVDVYALANAYWWLGQLGRALPALVDAHRILLAEGQRRRAALVALDTGYTFALRGEQAQASGWMSRGVRLLEREGDCAERGYLVYCDGEDACSAHDLDRALALAAETRDIGRRFDDPCLVALGVLLEGRARVKRGEVDEGMALLDEAMVAAVSDDIDPAWAGNIYCNLMLACWELADWDRAGEWTAVTARWCEAMPGAGPFMGICRVHRAQVLQLRGDLVGAEDEVRRVCDELGGFHAAMVAEAHYLLGELALRRADLTAAEAAYAAAHRLGRDPQPGLASLRSAQGRPASAAAMINRALAGAEADALARARLLPAAVEIFVAVGDLARARDAADELGALADRYRTPGLRAAATTAGGAVTLAGGDTTTAASLLRVAVERWHRIGARCETAQARLLLARALAGLGDVDGAAAERGVARQELAVLGVPYPPEVPVRRPDGLSAREAEVLRLVADGRSNEQIAAELVLSVRTVERHLATAYQKLGLHGRTSRAAAVRHILEADTAT
ncbi:MAG TPA: LuxR C-terminal-related transcriptional regulator, partial [Jiangellales bacterium]|nr:LuxR C-terminal-related transcriptional regulator [Jiangellales bacterium]